LHPADALVYFAYKNREETFPSLGMLTFGAHAFNSGVRRMQMASLLSASSLLFQFCWRCQKLAEPQPLLIALSRRDFRFNFLSRIFTPQIVNGPQLSAMFIYLSARNIETERPHMYTIC
jgi:hypothetical protein